jgi:four helix bundle protein
MEFACGILRLIDDFPWKISTDVIGRQLAKSASSVALNYRATCNARSRLEFVAKLGVVVEEADESEGWLDLLGRLKAIPAAQLTDLHGEARQLRAIFAKSLGTARSNLRSREKHRAVRPPIYSNDQITK